MMPEYRMQQNPDPRIHNTNPYITWGVVQSVSPVVRVAIEGDDTFTKITSGLDIYTPVESDQVLLLKADITWIIVGKIATL